MHLILSFIPLFILFLAFASCCKLSAYILRGRVVSWKNCFIFALLVVIVTVFITGITNFLSISLPLSARIVFTIVIHATLGAWFFRDRSQYADGEKLSWRGGAELAVLSLVFIGVIGIVLTVGVKYLQTVLSN